MRFGHLVVLKRSNQYIDTVDRGKKYLWECRCDCGQTVYRLSEKLRDEVNSSCKSCMEKSAVNAMVNSAGFVEGTQLSKLVQTSPNANSTSGVRGVFFNRRSGKWRASIKFQGKQYYLVSMYISKKQLKQDNARKSNTLLPCLKSMCSELFS